MKYIIRYHNKPHNYRITNVHIVKVCRGVLHVCADVTDQKTRQRGVLFCWGGTSYKDGIDSSSTFFSDAQEEKIVAELRLLPETVAESKFDMLDRMCKSTYRAHLISDALFGKAWDQHDCVCRNRKRR